MRIRRHSIAWIGLLALVWPVLGTAQPEASADADMESRPAATAAADTTETAATPDTDTPPPEVEVELNKLEPLEGACRAYLVTQNLSARRIDSLQLDLVMFDIDGIVAKRLAVEIGPMPADKTGIKVFDIPDLACPEIGQLLVNDVIACRDAGGARDDCLAGLSTGSRGDVSLIK